MTKVNTPADLPHAVKAFLSAFYHASDASPHTHPAANELYADFFLATAPLLMGPNKFNGRQGFIQFREQGWEKVETREHVVLDVYPKRQDDGKEDEFELMLRGTVDYGLKDGGKGHAEWAGHMVLQYLKEQGGYKIAFYQVWIPSFDYLLLVVPRIASIKADETDPTSTRRGIDIQRLEEWCKVVVARENEFISLFCAFPVRSTSRDLSNDGSSPLLEFDKKRREAKTKAITEVFKNKDKAEKERKEIYAERRRVAEHRIWHLKVISSILVLAFFSKRIAILALVPLMYSVFRHEMETLLEGKHSTYTHPKRPRALKVNKAPEGQPGMAMSYMYQPVEGGLADLSRAPILENAPVLLTSTDERYAGDGAKERTVPTWFKYASESSSSKDKGADEKASTSKK
ncbi:hypothetical protein QFC22_005090 [Naganishia vaughanmartiniae]|uniref:Uncharacterized protein n=1 Tax=Naganishia vaughanmartiniae TaxID=1424756 RepID=A0ACC2WY32_9TREE|nr:hypothetical protein QFC22_005090 [Naganishia vaughanmartiniae]